MLWDHVEALVEWNVVGGALDDVEDILSIDVSRHSRLGLLNPGSVQTGIRTIIEVGR